MMNPLDLWVSEYSAKQRCFHVHTLREALEKNTWAILRGYSLDWIPFAISGEWETASRLCDEMRAQMKRTEVE